MYVYGVRCTVDELSRIPVHKDVRYLTDYGILIFPAYTAPTCIQNNTKEMLSPLFLDRVQQIMTETAVPVVLEEPFLNDDEYSVVRAIRPGAWYYVPTLPRS